MRPPMADLRASLSAQTPPLEPPQAQCYRIERERARAVARTHGRAQVVAAAGSQEAWDQPAGDLGTVWASVGCKRRARIDSRADNPAYAGCSALCACERYADPRADRTGSRAVSLRLACSSLACEASALAPRRRMYRDPQASMQTEPQMSGRSAARRWRAS